MARPDSKRVGRSRDVGMDAARRLKELLRAGSASARPLLPLPTPPSLGEDRRSLKLPRSPDDDGRDE